MRPLSQPSSRDGGDVVGDGAVGEQTDLLDDVPDPPAQHVRLDRGHVPPSSSITPDVGSINRLIILRIVVLPHPDGPTKTTTSPRYLQESESTAWG